MKDSERIHQERRGRGLTQKALADAVGLSVRTISRMETGEAEPSLRVMQYLGLDKRANPSDHRGTEYYQIIELLHYVSAEELLQIASIVELLKAKNT